GIQRAHEAAVARLSSLRGVENVRVLGTMLALELVATDRGYLSGIGPALRAFALERGVLLRPLGDTVYLLPPYCTTERDLSRAYDVIAEFAEER
ncbi:MAG TPA: aminotransferase class III-fold pyridoxal phosphate-dependent enzyme, partial [Gemmatimonadaceae bacterium]|nr:aminotransferase class III-fold pyridoxal phosphate-dependent enzyme [Gemmatimonadaceae bacterium]